MLDIERMGSRNEVPTVHNGGLTVNRVPTEDELFALHEASQLLGATVQAETAAWAERRDRAAKRARVIVPGTHLDGHPFPKREGDGFRGRYAGKCALRPEQAAAILVEEYGIGNSA